ncbi:putative chymotrypsin A-like isoform 2 [Apostichopus japonicus]|uniref:Putative chymotrypsin A-like isoform 2 n=1 Tax=Stichopus japonicus TaxID=307972 RepID=A0A2G8LLL1_STIJA|nr:putative chymotrypsin A-like isoform 2 [Apostichopus japonicus]
MADTRAIIFILLATVILSGEVHGDRMSAKVFGGSDAFPGQFPFIGSLRNAHDEHICGATLISNDKAVTAAHCFDLESNETSDDLPSIAVFGDLNLLQPSLTHHQSMFDKKVHAQYNKTSLENDIALIYLKDPVKKFGINISKIPLANESFNYSSCFVVGWGKTKDSETESEVLQFAALNLYNNSACIQEFGFVDNATTVCAGSKTADACEGDSGGPLACQRDDTGTKVMDLVGVVSSGVEVCQAGTPGIYTRVSAYQDWIASRCHPNYASMPLITMFFVLVMVYCY